MAETIFKIVKVFIGSPGGLEDERQAAKRIVDEINQSHSEHWELQIKLVRWEATLPSYSRAQSLINQDLDTCEYFVGVIWNHWGSKPDDGDSRYSSGFEEEFERARARLEASLMKDIVLFFKDIPEVQLNDLGPSVKQVIAFRNKCVERHIPLFQQFKETSDFEPLFRASMEAICWKESKKYNTQSNETSDSGQLGETDAQTSNVPNSTNSLIGTSAAKFVTDLLQKPSGWEATSPHEIARLRLIAASTSRSGNDELYLGNHDANLLFEKRTEFNFSDQENRALIDAGVAGFEHQNVPLWHWITMSSGSIHDFERIRTLAVAGNSQVKSNAIRILQSASQNTPAFKGELDREWVIRGWLLGDPRTQEIESALDFLTTNGDAEDLTIIQKLLDEVEPNNKNRVAVTMIAMLTNSNLSKAFEKLIELDPDNLGKKTVNQLFAHPESISSETLVRCLTLKSDLIRKNAATLLHSRRAIDATTAEQLITDSDLEIRLVAVESLIQKGQIIEEATIKKALIRQRPGGLFGIGAGLFNPSDDSHYQQYQRNQLFRLSYSELQQKAGSCSIYDFLEISVLYERYTRRSLSEMRSNLEDSFKSHFDGKLQHLVSIYGEDAKVVAAAKGLEGFLRKRLTNNTLNALCAYADSADLTVVRKTLDHDEIDFSESVLRFLGRFGDWSDKDRILSIWNKDLVARSLLSMRPKEHAKAIAAALYAIGESVLIDLLRLDMGFEVRQELISEMSQKDILRLSEDILMAELNDKDETYRKTLALKCVQAMSQVRIRRLLDRYMNHDGYRYYNSIHCLDLGASMPRQVAKAIAKFELRKLE